MLSGRIRVLGYAERGGVSSLVRDREWLTCQSRRDLISQRLYGMVDSPVTKRLLAFFLVL